VIDAECSDAQPEIVPADAAPRIVLSDGPLQRDGGVPGFRYAYRRVDWGAMRLRQNALVVTLVDLPPP
jgi:hypothetical protein